MCVHKKAAVFPRAAGPPRTRPIRKGRIIAGLSIRASIVFGGHWYYSSCPSRSSACTAVAAIPTSILPTFYKIVFTRKNGSMVPSVEYCGGTTPAKLPCCPVCLSVVRCFFFGAHLPACAHKLHNRFREVARSRESFHQQLNHRV